MNGVNAENTIMKINLKIVSFLLMALTSPLAGQVSDSSSVKKISVCEVNLYFGSFNNLNTFSTLDDFMKLAPNSKLLKNDFSQYEQYQSFGYNSSSMLSVNMGIHFGNKQGTTYRPNPLLRVGFTYFNSSVLSTYLSNTQTVRADTLLSNQTGQAVYVDSTINRSYNMQYSSDQLRLDVSLNFRTDPAARWSFYSGIGLAAGVSLRATTSIYYSTYASLQSNSNYYYPYVDSYNDSFTSEVLQNEMNFGFNAYVPLGLDFRMGKKRPFWKRTHLFYEVRPGVNFTSIPELSTMANVSVQHGLGIRINWE